MSAIIWSKTHSSITLTHSSTFLAISLPQNLITVHPKDNNLVIQGIKYTDILDAHKNSPIANRAAWGYLDDQSSYQRGFYIKYRGRNNPQTYVDHRCMYKSFGIIMKSIDNPSKLNGFCDYFAKLVGFASRADMFQDQSFMQKCKDFTSDIIQTADNRNNASHGGSFISLTQCTDDKRIVLNNLSRSGAAVSV